MLPTDEKIPLLVGLRRLLQRHIHVYSARRRPHSDFRGAPIGRQ